jgi:hypothetical protein
MEGASMTAKAGFDSLKVARNLFALCFIFVIVGGALLVVALLTFDIDFPGALWFICAFAIGAVPGVVITALQLASLKGEVSVARLLGRDR